MNHAKRPDSGGLVYSTDAGRMCPGCRQATAQCTCGTARSAPAGNGVISVARETKGRGGKGVTVVRGLTLGPLPLAQLARELKALCGSGGTVKGGVIEIQGDHREQVVAHLRSSLLMHGAKIKLAGA